MGGVLDKAERVKDEFRRKGERKLIGCIVEGEREDSEGVAHGKDDLKLRLVWLSERVVAVDIEFVVPAVIVVDVDEKDELFLESDKTNSEISNWICKGKVPFQICSLMTFELWLEKTEEGGKLIN